MASPVTHIEQLERILLRRGVGALEADRARCADCGRTPLTGEYVHLYGSPRSGSPRLESFRSGTRNLDPGPEGPHSSLHTIVCELCRTTRRDAPVASEIVRHCGHGQTVRLTVRAA